MNLFYTELTERYKVNDIEFYSSSKITIPYYKIKPLRVASWIYIILHYQIVLTFSDLTGSTGTLKAESRLPLYMLDEKDSPYLGLSSIEFKLSKVLRSKKLLA